jgi:hypothetical protein
MDSTMCLDLLGATLQVMGNEGNLQTIEPEPTARNKQRLNRRWYKLQSLFVIYLWQSVVALLSTFACVPVFYAPSTQICKLEADGKDCWKSSNQTIAKNQ